MMDDLVLKAFRSIGINPPEDDQICIYKSGIMDSSDLMQLLLEIEIDTGKRIDLPALMQGDVTLSRLRESLNGAE